MSTNPQTFLTGSGLPRQLPTRHVYLPSVVSTAEILRLHVPATDAAGGGLPGREQGHRRRHRHARAPIGGRLKRLLSSKALLVSARAINQPSLEGCSSPAPAVLPLQHHHQFPLSPSTLQADIRRTDSALPLSATICSINRVMRPPSAAAVFTGAHQQTPNSIAFPSSLSSGLGRHGGNNGAADAVGDGTPIGDEDSLAPDRRDRSCFWHLCPSLRKRCGRSHHLDCSLGRGLLAALPCRSLCHFNGRRMPNENLFVLSMIQILCGMAAVILSGVAVTKMVFLYQMATGLWSGFLMLATGFHGILTSRRCNPRTLISLLVFCVLVALAACLLASVSVAGLIEDGLLRPETSFSVLSAPIISSVSAGSYYDLIPPSRRDKSISSEGRIKYPLLRDSEAPIRFAIETQQSRIHQVVLHILLLVIGILEASVSVACAVLCCRQVCPSSAPPISAINYLRNRGATLIPGGAEFLLAVAVEPEKPPPTLLDYKIPPPDFHPSVQPFLPRPGRRAFVLTQAETGIHALAAAQTVAGLLSPNGRNRPELSDEACTCQQVVLSRNLSLPSRPFTRWTLRRFRSRLRPRGFRRTSEISQKRAAAAQLMSQLISLLPTLDVNSTNTANGSSRYSISFLYVLSSPSPSEPPMIFPPFPPAYCREETRLESPPAPDINQVLQPQTFTIDPFLCSAVLPHPPSTSQAPSFPSVLRAPTFSLGRSQLRGGHTNLPRPNTLPHPPAPIAGRSSTRGQLAAPTETSSGFSAFRSAWPFQRQSNSLSPAVTLVGDRILQPVLVIEDQLSNNDRPPPHYASSERLQTIPPPFPFQMTGGR